MTSPLFTRAISCNAHRVFASCSNSSGYSRGIDMTHVMKQN